MTRSPGRRRADGRVLDPARVVATFDKLQARVNERFPDAGLATVCADLALVARETAGRARAGDSLLDSRLRGNERVCRV